MSAELELANDGWGWPLEAQFLLPAPGDTLVLPNGESVTVIFVSAANRVVYDILGCLPSDGQLGIGHLRYAMTRDGLYWHHDGSERDGYEASLIRNDWPGRRRWKIT